MATLQQGKIIQQALLKVGNVNDYNDTRSKKYRACEAMMDGVIQQVCSDNTFRFQSTTVKLTYFEISKDTGEYIFNLPQDFEGMQLKPKRSKTVGKYPERLSVMDNDRKFNNFRIQNEFIFADTPKVVLNYVRRIPLTEIPMYMSEYLSLMLARELCLMYPEYNDRIVYIERRLKEEKANVSFREGYGRIGGIINE